MAFDQPTRRQLESLVSDARRDLVDEFRAQLRTLCGLDPETGAVIPLERLTDLDDAQRETARLLQETVAHYQATSPQGTPADAIDRVLREQAFTVLNRLAALRMAEARGLIVEAVGGGFESKGFRVYSQVAGPALGSVAERYRCFLFSLFDELALDLPVLFDRWAPQGRLFPGQTCLDRLFALLNAPQVEALWAEDETIGWIYQYFNSKEERKKMREESAAPRNSRELAVRNQFFTPRYVVEFLTDNTLGRTWYEMRKGETRLAEACRYLARRPSEIFLAEGEAPPDQPEPSADLSQEELMKLPVHIPHRALKDPRAIRMLDPACGSMHFGLYAFDLFLVIYEEAWDVEDLPTTDGLKPLHDAYASREEFLRDVPRLILEHNIHGIDIDPRAVQIAGLSLWLRAQRAWQEQGVKPAERPRITRSNVVCAEPMPGEEGLLEEFISSQLGESAEGRLLGQLVRRVFEAMKLAGEAGALLRIEEEIAGAVAEAKKKWASQPRVVQTDFLGGEPFQQDTSGFDVGGITARHFWETAETRIYAALEAYAEVADVSGGYRRRLFADDTARGFAFVDLCRKRYDVVLMNPPFGNCTGRVFDYLSSRQYSWVDNVFCGFVVEALRLAPNGGVGAITDSTWLRKSSYASFRSALLSPGRELSLVADLGWETLDDANVAVCSFTSFAQSGPASHNMFCVRLCECSADVRGLSLLNALDVDGPQAQPVARCLRSIDFFRRFPGMALAYDTPDSLVVAFQSWDPLQPLFAKTRRGYSPGDTFRFFKCWWEVPQRGIGQQWWFLNNGGAYAPIVGDGYLVAFRSETWDVYRPLSGFRLESADWYGLPGIGWGKRTDYMYAYPHPGHSMFSHEGPVAFPTSSRNVWPLLAYLNSSVAQTLLNLYCGQHKETGYVAVLPTPVLDLDCDGMEEAGRAAEEVWRSASAAIRRYETSERFAGFMMPAGGLRSIAESKKYVEQEYRDGLAKIDSLVAGCLPQATAVDDLQISADSRPLSTFVSLLCAGDEASNLVSFLVGCTNGRWDIRLSAAEQDQQYLPDPFAPFPICPPGMLQNDAGYPFTHEDAQTLRASCKWDYPIDIPWDGILIDDPGHPLDIEARVRQVIEVIWKDRAEAIEHEACQILGVASLRDYFRRPAAFFADHLKRYSKSRRQAPIYWPLSTASGSYTLWIYYHRLTDQTLFTCVNDFIEPKLLQVGERLGKLRREERLGKAETKELEDLLDLEAELRDMRDEMLRLTRLPWKPNLNDGVQITAAPLWKLFAHKPWQKKLQETWKALEKGEYDWAHLAYSIWPERVKEKCRKDRSLAIAHDLEDLYVEVPAAPKKRGRRAAESSL